MNKTLAVLNRLDVQKLDPKQIILLRQQREDVSAKKIGNLSFSELLKVYLETIENKHNYLQGIYLKKQEEERLFLKDI